MLQEEAGSEQEEVVPSWRQRREGTPARVPEAVKRKRTPHRVYSPSPPRTSVSQRAGPSEDRNVRSGSRPRGGARGGARRGAAGISNSSPYRCPGGSVNSAAGGTSSAAGREESEGRDAERWAPSQPSSGTQASLVTAAGAASRSAAMPLVHSTWSMKSR